MFHRLAEPDTAKAGMSKLDRQAVTLDWLEEFRARVDEPISGEEKYRGISFRNTGQRMTVIMSGIIGQKEIL